MSETKIKIVLYSPEIPGNTGSIGRTCLALNYELILIRPYGFELSDKSVRRAGLDYWKHLTITEYQNWDEFITNEQPENIYYFSSNTEKSLYQENFAGNSYLVFGSESKGLPTSLLSSLDNNILKLPIYNKVIRSLNLSNAVCAVCYEVNRQLNFK